MWKVDCVVSIGGFLFSQVVSVEIDSSTQRLGNTAKVELPKRAFLYPENRVTLEREIKRGMKVTVKMGYDGDMQTEFTGYVTSVTTTEDRLVVQCEDAAYKLRKPLTNKSWKKATLKEIMGYITTGIEIEGDLPDVDFENFKIVDISAYSALKKLCDECGLVAFFQLTGKLFVGLNFVKKTGEKKIETKYLIKNDLTYRSSDEKRIRLEAVSLLKDNKRLRVQVGDADGEVRTMNFRNVATEEELKKIAENELKKWNYDGFEGGFVGFFTPMVYAGYTVMLYENNVYKGSYYCVGIKTSLGEGLRRRVELGIKV